MDNAIILGIESSCDETAASIVRAGTEILSNVVYSQIDLHSRYGGVVPEIASRKHIEKITLVVEQAFQDAGLAFDDIDAVAVTNEPGLIGALLVGVSFAKAFAYGLGKPLLAVNHLLGHVYANFIEHDSIEFPAVCLVVSGGHTSLILMNSPLEFHLLGETLDDAAGEAFDKIARFLGLGYPGGPAIQRAAERGQAGKVSLPRVFMNRDDLDFSFSGLKTAAMNMWNKLQRQPDQGITVEDMAAEFQAAVVDVLIGKSIKAARQYRARSLLMAGGVAANGPLRSGMVKASEAAGIPVYYPSLALCTDNAAMIAGAAYEFYKEERWAPLSLNARASQDIF